MGRQDGYLERAKGVDKGEMIIHDSIYIAREI